MAGDESIEAVLATADGSDVNTFCDEFIGKCLSYAGCCADEEDVLVWERHNGTMQLVFENTKGLVYVEMI